MAKNTDGKAAAAKSDIRFMDSIKTRLIGIMVLVTAVPLIVAVIVSYVTSTNKAMKDAQDILEWQVWYINSDFQKIVLTNMNMIRSIADNPTIINYVKGEGNIPYDAVQATILECDAILADGDNTSITDATGMQIARGTGDFIDVSAREYFKNAYGRAVCYSYNSCRFSKQFERNCRAA
ncbi:hypothetical protein [Butyrivibrio sp. YAB3001]|uniref:hypothetical protein n=1 Tax=Butyrivibrio sp. YAB3001 TaxID=1520812 RepID=UPI0008F6244F|nr:hypothetical protein [Butyrivibrio sp. YAB3001]SFC43775.1 methyl-accepting chemotaxis protein [Butyrivibrio sp. YAB3001]